MSSTSTPVVPKADRIDVPGAIVEQVYAPSTREDVVDVVAAADAGATRLLVCGGRTRLHWANPARGIQAALSLHELSGIDEFEPDEGVLRARAGTPIAEIQKVVRAQGWELPLDPPGATSTVGGTIASAATGPRAQAFGGVSDAILGLDVVGADGVPSKCGGRVVKNVTGYDMAKLYCGSFGTLAVVTGAWLRLRPSPATRVTLCTRVASGRAAFEVARSLADRTSVRAFVWNEAADSAEAELVIELAGSEEGVADDRERIVQALREAAGDRGGKASDETSAELGELVQEEVDRIDRLRDARAETADDGVVLRTRVLSTRSWDMLCEIRQLGLSASADVGLGVVHARGSLDQSSALRAIREIAVAAGGFATFERLPSKWRGEIDVFGVEEGAGPLMASLKARFDPKGILNPGRFVLGG